MTKRERERRAYAADRAFAHAQRAEIISGDHFKTPDSLELSKELRLAEVWAAVAQAQKD
jgi:hypothetical protein